MLNDKLWDVDSDGKSAVYAWTPKEDITAYELALCMPVLSSRIDSGTKGHAVDQLPDNAKRHFSKLG
jgi:hypothetical protein